MRKGHFHTILSHLEIEKMFIPNVRYCSGGIENFPLEFQEQTKKGKLLEEQAYEDHRMEIEELLTYVAIF